MDNLILNLTSKTQDIETLVKEYCVSVKNNSLGLFIIPFIMWMLEPVAYRILLKLESTDETYGKVFNIRSYMFLYKYLALGLMFMGGLLLWMA